MNNLINNILILSSIALVVSNSAIAKRVNTEGNSNIYRVKKFKNIPQEWQPLLNPKTKEFWKEGNHIPDEGFLLFAQNPESAQYAKLWLLRMETKAKVLNKMQKTVEAAQKEMVQKGLMEDRYWQFEDLKKGKVSNRLAKTDLKKLNFYFIFSSTCPHCKALAKKLTNFPNLRPLQVDKSKIMQFSGLQKTTRASQETITSYAQDGIVPVLVIHNPKSNVVTKITGNRPLGEYYMAANTLLKGGK